MASAQEVKSFIDSIGPLAVKTCAERGYSNAQVWTCIAQACIESNYGLSKIMKNANAFFGIKATSNWVKRAKYGGLVYNASTKECYDGKNYTNINACFRAYYSMQDSIEDYFDLLELDRYKDSLNKKSVEECITIIKTGGYATSPTYINTITSIYNKYKTNIEKYTIDSDHNIELPAKTDDEIVEEVIKGLWGNGAERKKRLTAAGYDFVKIQLKVNNKLWRRN